MPRTFKLYEELEKAEHAQQADQSISYGLVDGKSQYMYINQILATDQSFTNWNGTIIGPPNTNFDNRIYFLNITCGENYPEVAPTVKFNSKCNIPSVNQSTGEVNMGKVGWTADSSMEKLLIKLKNEMIANKKSPQPADGEMY